MSAEYELGKLAGIQMFSEIIDFLQRKEAQMAADKEDAELNGDSATDYAYAWGAEEAYGHAVGWISGRLENNQWKGMN